MPLSTLVDSPLSSRPLGGAGVLCMEESVRADQESLATRPKTKDEAIISTEACKLIEVARLVYTDPVIQELRARLAEKEEMILNLRFTLETCALEVIGPAAVLEAIKMFAHGYFGLVCSCKFCANTFNEPQYFVKSKMRCKLFDEVIALLRQCNLSFGFMLGFKGNEMEDIPPIPADFSTRRTIFIPETISHVDKHIVFERMGNVYDFKFGTPLHCVDSVYHPEALKLRELIRCIREKTMQV